ncbi:hypothetical protein HB435_002600 [Salmonella enterica subsp. enterica serovar Stanley]|nr:hypothetical protein [Salmonella enterica subsp. enterica serovar Stanley]
MNIQDLVGKDRDLVVVALQALHRERVSSFNSACTACSLAGKEWPDQELFGINEVTNALRMVGALPVR